MSRSVLASVLRNRPMPTGPLCRDWPAQGWVTCTHDSCWAIVIGMETSA
jgi:hypothetical protein